MFEWLSHALGLCGGCSHSHIDLGDLLFGGVASSIGLPAMWNVVRNRMMRRPQIKK